MSIDTRGLSFIERTVLLPVLSLHSLLYRRTNGRIGHRMPGMPPSLLLHTTGAKSGLPRTTTLTYARDGREYLVVASMGGAPTAPGWYHNLRKDPKVKINVGASRISVNAIPALPDDPDYERLWQIVNDNNANRYTAYQERTTRPIPVVRLVPAGA
jgi:deazaflavin-dependent oxidoreductase (nitroreductase family)